MYLCYTFSRASVSSAFWPAFTDECGIEPGRAALYERYGLYYFMIFLLYVLYTACPRFRY